MKILFTGFEPFDGGTSNPSYACLRELPPTIGTAELVTMELPVSFRRAPELLLKGMDAEGPDAVICLGLAANRKKISLEKVGLNYAYARIPDNDGMQPRDIPLDPSGPAACFLSHTAKKFLNRVCTHSEPYSRMRTLERCSWAAVNLKASIICLSQFRRSIRRASRKKHLLSSTITSSWTNFIMRQLRPIGGC